MKRLAAEVSQGGTGGAGEGARGPTLVEEPPDEVWVAAGAGAVRLPCRAAGRPPPRVRWLDAAGADLPLLPPHRYRHAFYSNLFGEIS